MFVPIFSEYFYISSMIYCPSTQPLTAISVIIAEVMSLLAMALGAKKIHQMLLHNILRVSQMFFDINPHGRILNRFSQDLKAVDDGLPDMLLTLINCMIHVSQFQTSKSDLL